MPVPPVQYAKTSDGFSLAYAVSGAGLPLVLLSAPFSHVQLSWEHPTHQPLLQALSERFLLVQYDSRGQGMSTRGLTPDLISIEHLCLDLETVIAKLGLEEVVLLAGGHVGHAGILYAARHPGRVKALVLTHCGLVPEARPRSLFEAVPMENWDVFLHNLLPRSLSRSEREAGLRRLRQTISQADYGMHVSALFQHDSRPYLAQLRAPVLIVHARDFPHFPVEESMKLASEIAGARFVSLPGETLYGDPGALVTAIEDFLASVLEMSQGSGGLTRLSRRETEVLHLIAAGKSNQQIADDLVLSLRTVERHITNLYAKIGAHGKADATAYALRHGLS